MTLKDLRLGFSKRPYLQRFIKMVMTQGELLKLIFFSFAVQICKSHPGRLGGGLIDPGL